MSETDTAGNGTQDDAAAVAGMVSEGTTEGTTEGTIDSTWSYADGVAGQGDAPEWFKSDKYNSVADQAKAYKDLESRFGSFTGAPEEFKVPELNEELTKLGIEIAADDPIFEKAVEFAKASNMNQEGFNQMVELYAMQQAAEMQQVEQIRADEMKALGDNAESRINNLSAWANANLPPDLIPGFNEMAQTAEAVKAMERLVAMTRSAPLAGEGAQAATGPTSADVKAMLFATDEHGRRKIDSDPAFKAEYLRLRDKVWGTEPHRTIIGG